MVSLSEPRITRCSCDDMHWHCHERFNRMPQGAVAGGIAVVIDVLRASTTIVTALASGAARVRPVVSVAEARGLAAASGPLLGGERGGRRIEGFDLGNSPLEYTAGRVAGREIVITTTNGTAALEACTAAAGVLVGAIVNRSAVAAHARRQARRCGAHGIHLVCAGTDGEVTEEDLLAAGAILDAAAAAGDAAGDTLGPEARRALGRFRDLAASATGGLEAALVGAFASSRGGRNLLAIGMQDDLPAAAAIDRTAVVPRLERRTGWLVADGEDAG